MVAVIRDKVRFLVGGVVLLGLASCSTLGYYRQAVWGQWQVMQARTPVSTLLAKPGVDADTAAQLELATEIVNFAETTLELPAGKRYRSYADIRRPYVVWNLFAAGPLDLDGEQWCYPFVGCTPYRGYFSRKDAEAEADRYRQRGYETFVGGVPAYSTLGWFDDPLLNTFVHWPEPELANLLLHELSHSEVWLAGDVSFNESFATFTGEAGAHQWMLARGRAADWARWREHRSGSERFRQFVLHAKAALDALYRQVAADAVKHARRDLLLGQLRACYQGHRHLLGHGRYDAIIDDHFNNAYLVSVSTYEDWVPAFAELFDNVERNWRDFFAAVKQLSELESEAREKRLEELREYRVSSEADHQSPEQVECEAFSRHGADAEVAT
jgi:predicted aminopeptidase